MDIKEPTRGRDDDFSSRGQGDGTASDGARVVDGRSDDGYELLAVQRAGVLDLGAISGKAQAIRPQRGFVKLQGGGDEGPSVHLRGFSEQDARRIDQDDLSVRINPAEDGARTPARDAVKSDRTGARLVEADRLRGRHIKAGPVDRQRRRRLIDDGRSPDGNARGTGADSRRLGRRLCRANGEQGRCKQQRTEAFNGLHGANLA